MMKNKHAIILGRRGGKIGGKSRSRRKIEAARRNGARGGRTKKVAVDEAVKKYENQT